METKLTILNIGKLKTILSIFNTLICYLTFWLVDSKQMDFTIIQNHLSYLIAALLVGLATYATITIIKLIIEKTINERNRLVNSDIQALDKATGIILDRLMIHDVLSAMRLHSIYPEKLSNAKLISKESMIQDEIKEVRENFRRNRDEYKISLDTVEDQLKRMYGDYYDGKKALNESN